MATLDYAVKDNDKLLDNETKQLKSPNISVVCQCDALVRPTTLPPCSVCVVYHDNDDDDDDGGGGGGSDSHDRNNDTTDEQLLFNQQTFNLQRQNEIQQLTQFIQRTQPTNDDIANIILQQLNGVLQTPTKTIPANDNQVQNDLETTTTTTTTTQHPYPPIHQPDHPITDHDRPYADYGHLDRQTIANEFHFNLEPLPTNRQIMRFNAKSFAITSWTNVSKEVIMNEIKRDFGLVNIQYICIGEEISELNHQRHLHIQIIFKEKINRRKPFLDDITQTHCNYQVTQNDCAWNEYIKKGGNYLEFGTFQSTTQRKKKQWPSLSQSSSSSSSTTSLHTPWNLPIHSTITTVNDSPTTTINTSTSSSSSSSSSSSHHSSRPSSTTITTTTSKTVRAQAEERRKQKEIIAKQAIEIAKKNVDAALKYIKDHFSWDFLHHFQWYQATFNYIYLQEQQEIAQTHRHISKKYTWSESFPDCTPELRKAVDQWIQDEFNRTSRAKCLILIGPTGTGKTTFAKSLPGDYNYFKGRWRLDSWNDNARYSIFDDIDWDKYEQLGFPSKKDLLTQNGPTNATDKYKKSREINVRQPAIVLLNPGRPEGSLTALPTNKNEQEDANYWQQRAIVYRMGPNEYFHKPEYHTNHHHN